MLRSHNPALSNRLLTSAAGTATAPPAPPADAGWAELDRARRAGTMTVEGTVYKTALLLAIVAATAAAVWWWAGGEPVGLPTAGMVFFPLLVVGVLTGIKPHWAPVTGPLYALVSGGFIGVMTLALEPSYPGVAVQAGMATMATSAGMLFAWRTGLIRVTERFRRIVITAVIGVVIFYAVNIAATWLGAPLNLLWSGGMLGVGISLLIVGIASMSLVLDFDLVSRLQGQAEKRMEWYGAFALTTTLVWLYIEMLRLIAQLRGE